MLSSVIIFDARKKFNNLGATIELLRSSNGGLQSLQHVGVQILRILNTTAHANKVVIDTSNLTLVLGDTSVGHASGNLTQTLNTTQTLGQSEDLSVLTEKVSSLLATLDAEAKHTTTHAITVLLDGNGTLGVRVDSGVVDGDNVGGSFESLGDDGGVLGGLACAQVQGLETAVSEPAVEGGGDGSNGVLEEGQTLLQGFGAKGGNTHADIGVTVDVLGHGVHDEVGTVVQGILDIGAHECVVDNNHDAVLVGNVGNDTDVHQAEGGVGGGLNPDKLG